jgi:hypothetical protein
VRGSQALVHTEDGIKKGHVHVQGAFAVKAKNFELCKHVVTLLRLLVGLKRGCGHPLNVVVVVHPVTQTLQPRKRQVNRIFSFCPTGNNCAFEYVLSSIISAASLRLKSICDLK